jgi:outer membrane immunogenic protein
MTQGMMMKALVLPAVALIAAMTPDSAQAEHDTTGFYAGASLGQAALDVNNEFDESGTAFGVSAGYQFTENLGLESTFFVSGDLSDYGSIHTTAITLAPKLTFVFNHNFSGFVKAGLASAAVLTEEEGFEHDFDGMGWVWGIGLNYAMTQSINLRLAYEQVDADLDHTVFSDESIDTGITNFAFGVHYQF